MPTATRRYELWEDGDSLTFFDEANEAFRNSLSPGSRLVWECHASSWEEAQQMKHDHLGWPPYIPHVQPNKQGRL